MVHIPVLLRETIDALAPVSGGVYVDGTLGRAGHSAELLRRIGEGTLLGIDRDDQAIEASTRRLARFRRAHVRIVRGCHGEMASIAAKEGFRNGEVDGILLDLGVSSPQLDDGERGFSFRIDGPLDMRMDRTRGVTAAEIVATYSRERLEELFRALGEEPRARQIAKAIVGARERDRFETTLQLAAFIEKTVGRHGTHHPATRVFQALRMAVNDETGELSRALEVGLGLLKTGGRFAIITFESLTDRIVKHFFAAHVGRSVSLQQGGTQWEGVVPRMRLVFRHAVTPAQEELESNPWARSAKLRVAERI